MVRFSPLDFAVFAAFIAALLALGFSARVRENSLLQYLVAGRNLSLPMFVATLVCTWYGGILGMGESVSYFGVGTWLMLGVPYYVFALLYAVFLARRVRGAEEISLPERLRRKFGAGPGLFGAVLLFLLAIPSAHVLMLGILTEVVTGWSLPVAVAVGALVGTSFLYRGGLLADVRMSLLAFVMMYVGFATLVVLCGVQHPPAETFAAFREDPRFQWNGGQSWPMILSFFILGAWTLIDPGFHQRVASAQSPQLSQKGVFVSVACWIVFDLLSISAGLYALALVKETPSNMLLLFPILGDQVLPPGLKALFFCGMVGTILSAMVGYTLISGATLGREILAPAKGWTDEGKIALWTRIGLFVSLVAAIGLALTVQSVVAIWYSWGGVIVGAMLLPVLWSYSSRELRVSPRWILASMIFATAVSLGWWIYGTTQGNPFLTVRLSGQEFSLGTLIPGLAVSAGVLALGRWGSNGRTEA